MLIKAFCQFQIVNPMHESGDSHTFWGSFHAPNFHFEPFHEVFDGLSVLLLDVVDFYMILTYFFCCMKYAKKVFTLLGIRVLRKLLKLRIRGVNGSTASQIHGIVKSSSSVAISVVDPHLVEGVGVTIRLPNAMKAFLILRTISIRSVQPGGRLLPRERSLELDLPGLDLVVLSEYVVPTGRAVSAGRVVPAGRAVPAGRVVPSGRAVPAGRAVPV
nr:hypothetical protein [Tanacetum cinerariifolium]